MSVIAKVDNQWQESNNSTLVSWIVEPSYGYDHATMRKVRTVFLANIQTGIQTFTRDGKNDGGFSLPPGYLLFASPL